MRFLLLPNAKKYLTIKGRIINYKSFMYLENIKKLKYLINIQHYPSPLEIFQT